MNDRNNGDHGNQRGCKVIMLMFLLCNKHRKYSLVFTTSEMNDHYDPYDLMISIFSRLNSAITLISMILTA